MVKILPLTPLLNYSMTVIRNVKTERQDFVWHSNRIIRFLLDAALNELEFIDKTVQTPTGASVTGVEPFGEICGISIMRAGDSMVEGLRSIAPSVRIGKILIQRNEETAEPVLFYSKLPKDVKDRTCLLLDPMLATGGSAIKAVEVLIENGVKEEKIIFVNLISCPEGIEHFEKAYPKVKLITGNS